MKRNKHEGNVGKPSKSFGENLGCRSNMIVLDGEVLLLSNLEKKLEIILNIVL